jgi:Cu2+-exporting ATPase
MAACPACGVADGAVERAQKMASHTKRYISVPDISCAGCISGVERALLELPDVSEARVNFSLKRATITAAPEVSDESLINTLKSAGYAAFTLNDSIIGKGAETGLKSLGLRIGVSGFAMMNVMLLSVAIWSGAQDTTREMFHWISAMIALPATIFSAQPFFSSALHALRGRRLNMDVPIALAIILALALSLYETSAGGHHAYFDAALSLTFFLLIGRFLDQRIKGAARSAAKDLAALEPAMVTIDVDGTNADIKLIDLRVDDVIFLPAGSRLPADGTLIKGSSLIDMSFITGECDPVQAYADMALPAGVINLTGPMWVRATNVGENSSLQRIATMIEQAESARNSYTSLADRAAALYAPIVHILALAAFASWMAVTMDLRFAINVAVAVLIITCPCALGLAVPAVATAVNNKLFRKGVILKGETALERLAEIDTVVFDKTGTLSQMRFDIAASDIPQMGLPVLRALTEASAHPISKAIFVQLQNVQSIEISNIEEVQGFGLRAQSDGKPISITSQVLSDGGQATIFEFDGGEYVLQFDEHLIPDARDMIQRLNAQGYETILLSGDKDARVRKMAKELSVDAFHSEMKPEEKAEFVKTQITDGRFPLMVGDGLNDTAALAFAHASLAPSTALDISRNAADVLIVKNSLAVIPDLLRLAKVGRKRMLQNFVLAIGYNVIAVPLAFMGLVTPLIAALMMSASSVTVIANAVRISSK